MTMIPVGVRIDQRVYALCGGFRVLHLLQHFAGQRQVKKRIDKHRLFAIDDQAGIAPSPAASWG